MHAFVVAVPLMKTKMNADFIFNLVRAVQKSAWGKDRCQALISSIPLPDPSKFLKEQVVEGREGRRAGVKKKEQAERETPGGADGVNQCDVVQGGEGEEGGEGDAAYDATPALVATAAHTTRNSFSQPLLPPHLFPLPSGRPSGKYHLYKFKRAMGALQITQDMMTSVQATLQSTGFSTTLLSPSKPTTERGC